jgi:hypothetical protein
MKTRFIAFIAVVASAACLPAAPATVSYAGGIEVALTPQVVDVSGFKPLHITSPVADIPSAAVLETGIADSTYAAQFDPVAVLKDAQPTALTKVAAVSTQVRLKVAHRAPASVWFICAAASSPPTTSFAPDKPEAGLVGTTKTPLAWHMPADNDPVAIEEGRHAGLSLI